MMSAARAGELKAMWIIGYDVLLTNANARATARALEALDLVVVQDLFMTETARRFGTVFLPACSAFEKDGTFMNAERRIQRVRQALHPAGASKPDWEIICALARAFDAASGFTYAKAEEIWDEIRRMCDGARGMSYARLDRAGLQWPCPDEAHPGTPILHVDTWSAGERAPLMCIGYEPTPEQTTPKYPFVLNTGRTLYAFNADTMTGRGRTRELRASHLLDISPEDADAADLHDGELVRLVSRHGEATLPIHVNPRVRAGDLFATFHTAAAHLNDVTGTNLDQSTGTPEYKVTAVHIKKARS
jgi:formate dehydrogenase major subunit